MTHRARLLVSAVVVLASAVLVPAQARQTEARRDSVTRSHGGIVRGDTSSRRLALVFTGHEYAEGAGPVLDALRAAGLRASFFLTGDFVRNPAFAPVIRRIIGEGHYIGPHSDTHLLYCDWKDRHTLVTRESFERDLLDNLRALGAFGVRRSAHSFWVPAYEWYNEEVARWSAALGLEVVNFTPGTRASADYTGEADPNFVSSAVIFDSIRQREATDPHGLNGFILLMHIGAGPGRRDKFFEHLPALLTLLRWKHYEAVRVDELLAMSESRRHRTRDPFWRN